MNLILLVLAALPYALGWITGKVAVVLAWIANTVKWGWDDAHKKRQPKKAT